MQKVIIQTKRKDRILCLRCSSMKPRLLVFAVVLAVLFVAIGASMSSAQGTFGEGLGDTFRQIVGGWKVTAARPSFLVVPVLFQTGDMAPFLLRFYQMYPDARMPKEFLSVSGEGINMYKGYRMANSSTLYPSILLTMAYQQGYEIEAVTDSYILLVKSVNIEGEEEGENNAESNGAD